MYKVGDYLRSLREEKGLNQRQLADAVGLDDAIISHLEQNRRGINIDHAIKLAKFFEVTVDEFVSASMQEPSHDPYPAFPRG